jgi:5,10-methylenetetrahydromethanopterin reductase
VSTLRSISFALVPGPLGATADVVAEGEALGFDAAWIADQGFGYDPFVAVAACSSATTNIRLGVGLTSPFTRLPVQIARGVASLHELAEGRLALALGTGNIPHVLRPLGIAPDKAVTRIRDAIHVIRALLRGEAVSHEGVDTLSNVRLDVPVSIDVPIYLGTRRPGMLSLSGELADGVLAESLFAGDGSAYVLENVAAGALRSSRAITEVDVVAWQVVVVTDEPDKAVAERRAWAARTIQNGPADAMEKIGVGEAVYADVMAAMARGDLGAAESAVPDSAVLALMAIGPPATIIDRLQAAINAGATSINVLWVGSVDGLLPNLRRFAADVMPALRAGA